MSEDLQARAAEVIWTTSRADEGTISAAGANIIAAALAEAGLLADAGEVAATEDALARTKRGAETLGRIVERQCRDALDAIGRHDLIAEDGDGDWGLVWELLAELRPRAERAEATIARVRAALDGVQP